MSAWSRAFNRLGLAMDLDVRELSIEELKKHTDR